MIVWILAATNLLMLYPMWLAFRKWEHDQKLIADLVKAQENMMDEFEEYKLSHPITTGITPGEYLSLSGVMPSGLMNSQLYQLEVSGSFAIGSGAVSPTPTNISVGPKADVVEPKLPELEDRWKKIAEDGE